MLGLKLMHLKDHRWKQSLILLVVAQAFWMKMSILRRNYTLTKSCAFLWLYILTASRNNNYIHYTDTSILDRLQINRIQNRIVNFCSAVMRLNYVYVALTNSLIPNAIFQSVLMAIIQCFRNIVPVVCHKDL